MSYWFTQSASADTSGTSEGVRVCVCVCVAETQHGVKRSQKKLIAARVQSPADFSSCGVQLLMRVVLRTHFSSLNRLMKRRCV